MRLVSGCGFAVGLWAASCNVQSDLPCQNDEQCLERGEGGQCEFNNFCSFPDETCATGRRWDDRAPDSIAGQCYEPGAASGTDGTATEGATDTDAGGTTGGDPTTGVAPTTDPSTTTSATTDPTAGATTTGSEPGTSSTGGAATTTGPAQTCDEQYGAAADYMLCMEEPETCAFNTTMAMAMSCNDVCTTYGGECLAVQLNEADLCVSTGEGTCDQMDFNDAICVCSRT